LIYASNLPLIFRDRLARAALVPADSISWRVFKNPLSLVIGGVAAVIMELAEPRVRTGVWEHTKRHGERFEAMADRLERSEILFEFLAIMRWGARSAFAAEAGAVVADPRRD
jgi:uncharacterized protein (DUF2236 family)